MLWEHKLYNPTLAENVRNGVLEPLYYWQLEHQMLTAGVDEILFTCSDGTWNNRVSMIYESVPERRQKLIEGWKIFCEDLAKYELKAKPEPLPEAEIDDLPALASDVIGSEVVSNLGDIIPIIRTLASEYIAKNIETDHDLSNRNDLNKKVDEIQFVDTHTGKILHAHKVIL